MFKTTLNLSPPKQKRRVLNFDSPHGASPKLRVFANRFKNAKSFVVDNNNATEETFDETEAAQSVGNIPNRQCWTSSSEDNTPVMDQNKRICSACSSPTVQESPSKKSHNSNMVFSNCIRLFDTNQDRGEISPGLAVNLLCNEDTHQLKSTIESLSEATPSQDDILPEEMRRVPLKELCLNLKIRTELPKSSEKVKPEKPEMQNEDEEMDYLTPSPKKKSSGLQFKSSTQSIKQERKMFGRFNLIESDQKTISPWQINPEGSEQLEIEEPVSEFDTPENNEPIEEESPTSHFTSDFRIMKVIGEGSFGTVYKCTGRQDSKLYAVKRTNRKIKGTYKNLALNEAEALISLSESGNHPNIVKFCRSWVEDSNMFIAMEYCPYTLRQLWMEKGSFTESELHKLLRELCCGLMFLHSRDIVHMDVKPENILISFNEEFKLADFGQARDSSKTYGSDIEDGDSRYLAPEMLTLDTSQIVGDKLKLADIFSLGMTLYEIITNIELPTRGSVWHELRNGQFTSLDQNRTVSEPFKNVIKQMLERSPDKRPTADFILQRAFSDDNVKMSLKFESASKHSVKVAESDYKTHSQENPSDFLWRR